MIAFSTSSTTTSSSAARTHTSGTTPPRSAAPTATLAPISVAQDVLAIEDAARLLRLSPDFLLRHGCPHYAIFAGRHGQRAQRFVRWAEVVSWITQGEAVGSRAAQAANGDR